MKWNWYKRLCVLLFCSFLLALPLPIASKHKQSRNGCTMDVYPQMKYFYAEKQNSIDVIALGDSNIYRGFSPMAYWEKQHIANYSLASASQPAWLSYYVLLDALSFQKPKVVVFELNELFADAQGKNGRYCKAINTLHSAKARLQAIRDVTSGFDEEDRAILYQTYARDVYTTSLHHVFVKDVEQQEDQGNFKGYLYNDSVLPFTGADTYMSRYDMMLDIPKENIAYIEKIIDLCKQKDITLLFTKLPTKEWTKQKSDMATSFAKKHHIPFLDMNIKDIGLDWARDTKDSGFHMNDAGAQKVTDAISAFIRTYVVLTKTQDQEVIVSYESSLKRYREIQQQSVQGDIK